MYAALTESPFFQVFEDTAAAGGGELLLEQHAVGGSVFLPLEPPNAWLKDPCWPILHASLGAVGPSVRLNEFAAFTEQAEVEVFGTSPSTPSRYESWDDGWPEFHERFPKAVGVLGLSQVAMSADGSSAMVYVQLLAGGSSKVGGYGGFARLAREAGQWRVQDSAITWVEDHLVDNG